MARTVIFTSLEEHRSSVRVPAGPAVIRAGARTTTGLQVPDSVREAVDRLRRSKGRDDFTVPIPAGLTFGGVTVVTGPQSSETAAARVWTATGTGPVEVTVANVVDASLGDLLGGELPRFTLELIPPT